MTQEMTAYYARRAAEYERVYTGPRWQDDLARLRPRVIELFAGRRVNGYWDVDQAEAFLVSRGPLEVIHEGPVEVAADVGAGGDGAAEGEEVAGGKVDALGVVDAAVEAGPIDVGEAVLGDVDRGLVALAHEEGAVVQAVRVDGPAEGGERMTGLARDGFGVAGSWMLEFHGAMP